MDFSIRAVREEDTEATAELLNAIIRAGKYTVLDKELTVEAQRDFILNFPERGVFNVAVCQDTGAVLGLQDVAPLEAGSGALGHVGVISSFVSLEAPRQGVGRRLSTATFVQAKALGFTKLSATIRADNPAAVAFYLSQGFELVSSTSTHGDTKTRAISGTVVAERRLQ